MIVKEWFFGINIGGPMWIFVMFIRFFGFSIFFRRIFYWVDEMIITDRQRFNPFHFFFPTAEYLFHLRGSAKVYMWPKCFDHFGQLTNVKAKFVNMIEIRLHICWARSAEPYASPFCISARPFGISADSRIFENLYLIYSRNF